MTDPVDVLDTYTHEHFLSLEDQIRAKRASHAGKMELIANDAHASPGYYEVSYFNRFSFNPDRRAWAKAADDAVRTGLVQRGINGKFYPPKYAMPNVFDLLAGYADLFKLVAWCAAFVGMFLVTMTQGPLMIAAYGVLGVIVTGAGIFATFVIAGCAYRIVYN